MTADDLRAAVRLLARQRGAASTLVGVLAIIAGVTAAAVEVTASYLWRPLPYPAADRLVAVDYPRQNGPSPRELMSVDAASVTAFAELAVVSDPDSFTVLGGGVPFTTDGRWISADVFAMFAVRPELGRAFTPDEASAGAPLVLIGHDVWREHFGGRADVIGQAITIRATIRQGEPETFTIVGVLPPRFWHVEERTGLVLPIRRPRAPWLVRLRPGVTAGEAAARLTALVRQHVPSVGTDWSVVVRAAHAAHVERMRPMLAATGWGVFLLAAVTLANLAFLQMSRGVARQREMAVRSALGAGRGDTLRLALAEGAACGAAAAILAVLIAQLLLRAGAPAVEGYFGRLVPGGLLAGPTVIPGAVAASVVLAGMLLATIMFAASLATSVPAALAGGLPATEPRARLAVHQVIVTAQTAVAFCLLVGAALMIRTAWHLGGLDLGFRPAGVLSANLTLNEAAYPSLNDRREFFRELVERLDRLPEITRAGITGWLPFRVGPAVLVQADAAAEPVSAAMQGVDAGYFEALQLRLREGRLIAAADRDGRDRVAVVGQALALAVWGEASPLGRTFRVRFSPEPGRGFGPYTVIGVVDDIRQSVMQPTPPQLFVAFQQQPLASNAFLQLRTAGRPLDAAPAVARVVREMNPELPLGSVNSLDAIVQADGLRPRLLARALGATAAMAIAVAMIGLYAVSAWIAQLRQREAALRVALGANRASVAALLARRGVLAVGGGLLLGWMAAVPIAAMLASELRGVSAGDLSTRVAVSLVLMTVSSAALFAPAWRAASENLAALLRNGQ